MAQRRCAPGEHLWCAVKYSGMVGEIEEWRPLTSDELRLIASEADAIWRINPSGDICCRHCDDPLDPRRPPDMVRRRLNSPELMKWMNDHLR